MGVIRDKPTAGRYFPPFQMWNIVIINKMIFCSMRFRSGGDLRRIT